MPSTEKSCLTQTGYQSKIHKVYKVATGAPVFYSLSKEICYAVFSAVQLYEIESWSTNSVIFFTQTKGFGESSNLIKANIIIMSV